MFTIFDEKLNSRQKYLYHILRCVFIYIILLTHFVFSQHDKRFKQITIEDGLSQSTVETIVQDKMGFMWFGTEDGLNRFDGYQFKIYKHDPDDPYSISNNNIWCLFVDRSGYLWAGTYTGGLNRFDPKTGLFDRFLHNPSDSNSISSNKIRSITEDQQGNLCIGTRDGGLNRMDQNAQRFQRFTHDFRALPPRKGHQVLCRHPGGFEKS